MTAGMGDFIRNHYRTEEVFDCQARHLGVCLVYDEAAAGSVAKPVAPVRLEAMATMPDDLRHELSNPLASLSPVRITELARRIAGLNPALGEALAHHADQFAYTAILHALKADTSNSNGSSAS